jgi:hypothetical protein
MNRLTLNKKVFVMSQLMQVDSKRSWLALSIAAALISPSSWAADSLAAYQRSWTGMLNQQKMSLFIQSIDTKQVKGYRIIGRERQAFTGTVKAEGKLYRLIANEPQKSRSNGAFSFLLNPKSALQLTGQWQSYQPNTAAQALILSPQDCNAKRQPAPILTDDDLQQPPSALSWMRNEIYARHGYIFINKELATSFAQEAWYMPCYFNVDAQLSPTEYKNIQRLKKAEHYASSHDWGR